MDDQQRFGDLIQTLKTLPASEGAELVRMYRASERQPRPGPFEDFWYEGGGQPTASGIDVTEKTALKFSPFFCGVRKISETVASLPRHIYRIGEKGKKKATDHYLYPILHLRPNPEQTSMQLWEAGMLHLFLWGNLYFYGKQINSLGQIDALWPLDPSKMRVKRPNPQGMLVYEYQLEGVTVNFPPWDILHIAGLGFNGLMGMNIVQLAREGIATGLAYEEYSARFFSNNATPSGFVEVPGTLDKETRKEIRKDWYKEYGGVSKSQLIGVLGQGMKFNPLTVHAKDAQFIESREFSVLEIARWLNIPPHLLFAKAAAADNKNEQEMLEFLVLTLRPWLTRIEQAVQVKLIHEDNITFEHRFEGLLRADTEARWESYIKGIQNGVYSINDVRELENMELIEGGDEHRQQMQMVPIGEEATVSGGSNGKDKEMEKLIGTMMKQSSNQKIFNKRISNIIRNESGQIVSAETETLI